MEFSKLTNDACEIPARESSIQQRLRWLRVSLYGEKGQTAFAQALGTHQSTYHRYETRRDPPQSFLENVRKITGCSAEWLLTGEGKALPAFDDYYEHVTRGVRALTDRVGLLDKPLRALRRFERHLEAGPDGVGEEEHGYATLGEEVAALEEENERLRRERDEDRGGEWPARAVEIVVPEQIAERMAELGDEARQFAAVPLLADAAAAGNPRYIDECVLDSYCIIYRPWLRNPDETTCIRVVGASMEPTLHHGSIVAVNHADRSPEGLVDKIVALVHPEEDGVLVRRLLHPRGYWEFAPDNPGTDDNGDPFPKIIVPSDGDEPPPNPIIGKIDWAWSIFP